MTRYYFIESFAINLSILDFKIYKGKTNQLKINSINLSILDFKIEFLKNSNCSSGFYKSIHIGF